MIIAIIWILLGVILLGFYNGLLILDDKTPEQDEDNLKIKKQWHIVGGCIFIYLTITAWLFLGVEYILFSLACFWSLFAGIVHIVGLNKPFFYVGTTAASDKLIRQVFRKKPYFWSGIIKTFISLIGLLLIILKNFM